MKGLLILIFFPVLWANAQSTFDVKIAEASKQLNCPVPNQQNPVTLSAQLVSDNDSVAVIVKVQMAPGWHIYQFVPSTLPYIAIDHVLQLPEGLQKAGAWQKTKPMASVNDPGVLIYEEEAVFIHKLAKSPGYKKGGVIQTGLYYQTCDLRQCLPPVEKIFELKY